MTDSLLKSRRTLLKHLAFLGVISTLPYPAFSKLKPTPITRPIPSSGQPLPVIGMGSHITFNVGNDLEARLNRTEVLRTFFDMGGQLIDSSPMYGSAEAVLGFCFNKLGQSASPLFSATKVWTSDTDEGKEQIADSQRLWGVNQLNLNQVHNLVNWRSHLDTLLQMKADKQLQYVGITTSHGRRHRDVEKIMQSQPIDFVQLTYHIDNRDVETRLLPLALEKGIAVIVNRPFSKGELFDNYQQHPLPDWVKEFDCNNWAQFLLKFIVSHPAVTCAIPATSRVDHMIENMGACYGRLPAPDMRQRMISYVQSL
ncbi:MAG: aldo/keto reductase [Gammaproteobacteria bacterium]|nr:aldo/keto reductase [Gammaproteobacteria bacterium]